MADNGDSTAEELTSEIEKRDLTGQVIGDFVIERLLGHGGMGEVYLAEQSSLKRPVALKVLRQDLVKDPNYRKRFESEAKAVASINHPNLVSVYAIGQDKGVYFMALEYVQGRNLREHLLKKGTVSVHVALHIMRKVASALQRASEEGIIHRDIKPENVLLTKKGDVKVADFGLARQLSDENVSITQTGVTMGTPMYMSPEQVEGKKLDHRTDIYSFGVMCYHMLAGEPPFRGETAMAVAVQHVKGKAPPLSGFRSDIPPALIKMIEKMMARNPDDRYQTARELLRDLNRTLSPAKQDDDSQHEIAMIAADSIIEEADPARTFKEAVTGGFTTIMSASNRTVTITLSLTLALLAGVGVGWSQREAEVFSGLPDKPTKPSIPKSIPKLRDGFFQLYYARHNLLPAQRREGLWAVLEWHPGDEDETIEAAQELMGIYMSRREYDQAMILAEHLIDRDQKKQKMFGYLFRGIIQSRQNNAEASQASFLEMLDIGRSIDLITTDQLRWLARRYFLALTANSEALGGRRDQAMIDKFWDVFLRER